MSKAKKVFAALLAIMMVLSVVSVSALAAGKLVDETAEDAARYTQTWTLSEPTPSGSQYKVNVILTTNYPVGPISFKLNNVSNATAVIGTDYYGGSANARIDCSANGLVLITPSAASTLEGKSLNNAVVATITYTATGSAPVIDANQRTVKNPAGTLAAARLIDSVTVNEANFALGQTATVSGSVITPPATEDATVTGINGAVVDAARGYVYGVPASTNDPLTYFETTGYIEMVANAAGMKNGTGAQLVLYADSSKSGSPIATYTLVIFGDVNGDGALSLEDAGAVGQVANYLGDPFIGAYEFAADVNCDGAISLEDAGTIGQVANYLGDPITNPWA